MDDEFSPYFSCVIKPKIIITTRPRPSAELFHFISALLTLIPNSYYYPRRDYELKEITEYSRNKVRMPTDK
jgi:ribosome production factor 1